MFRRKNCAKKISIKLMYNSVISKRVQGRKNEYKENRYRVEWENFRRFVANTMIAIISVNKQNTIL